MTKILHRLSNLLNNYEILLLLFIAIGFVLRLHKSMFEGIVTDEDAYAYLAWLISEGKVPYVDFFENNPPGALYIMALVFFLLGPNIISLRILSSLFVSFSCIFIYFLGKATYNEKIGLIAAIFYNFDFMILYFSYHPLLDPFMNFFIIIGIYFAYISLKAKKTKYILFSGIFIGLATLMKFPAIIEGLVVIIFIIYYVKLKNKLISTYTIKSIFLFLMGIILIFLGIISFFWLNKAFSEFFNAVILYYINTDSNSNLSFESLWLFLRRHGYPRITRIMWVIKMNKILWISGFGGALYSIKKHKEEDVLILSYFLITFLFKTILPTFPFHSFIQIMPPLCIFAGNLIYESYKAVLSLEIKLNYKLIILGLILSTIMMVSIWDTANRYSFQDERLLTLKEQRIIAEYVIKNTNQTEYVFAPPGILFLAQRESPSKGFYFTLYGVSKGPLILISGEDADPSILQDQKVRYSVLNDDFFLRQSYSEVAMYILDNYHLEKTFTFHGTSTYIYRAIYW